MTHATGSHQMGVYVSVVGWSFYEPYFPRNYVNIRFSSHAVTHVAPSLNVFEYVCCDL